MKLSDIKFTNIVSDVCFHSSQDIVAAGSIDGEITIHSYRSHDDSTRELMSLRHHREACRCIRFSADGTIMYSASRDKSFRAFDLNTGVLIHSQIKAHSSPLYCICVVGEHFLATGDDDGEVKLWDVRTYKTIMEEKKNEDYISDIVTTDDFRSLLVTSGDGTLTVYNPRKRTMVMQSEAFNTELLSVCVMKNSSKVVCGAGDKAVNIFNWGEWNTLSDRFPGFKGPVDSLVALNHDILLAGCGDGKIRAVNILPNRFLGIVGRHEGFPVEKVSLSHDKKLLASCSHDHMIKFWDLSSIDNKTVDARKKQDRRLKTLNVNRKAEDDFFYDLKTSESNSLDDKSIDEIQDKTDENQHKTDENQHKTDENQHKTDEKDASDSDADDKDESNDELDSSNWTPDQSESHIS